MGNLNIFSAKDLFTMNIPKTHWIVNELLPEGLILLCGKPKIGKSWFILNLAITVANGLKLFSNFNSNKCDVLYLAMEDSLSRLKERIDLICKNNNISIPDNLHLNINSKTINNGGMSDLAEFLEANQNTKLVIIDTLQKFKGVTKNNKNQYEADYEVMSRLKKMSDHFKIAFVFIHHTRKGLSEDIFDTASGTTGLTGAVDQTIILQKERNKKDLIMSITGRDVGEQEIAIRFDNYKWLYLGKADEYKVSKERQEILDLLKSSQFPLSPKEISDSLNKGSGAIRVLLLKMTNSNQISKHDGKYYIDSNKNGNTVTQ
jgi:RecA-family ATPase